MSRALIVLATVLAIVRSAPLEKEQSPADVPDYYELFNNPEAHLTLAKAPTTVSFHTYNINIIIINILYIT